MFIQPLIDLFFISFNFFFLGKTTILTHPALFSVSYSYTMYVFHKNIYTFESLMSG